MRFQILLVSMPIGGISGGMDRQIWGHSHDSLWIPAAT